MRTPSVKAIAKHLTNGNITKAKRIKRVLTYPYKPESCQYMLPDLNTEMNMYGDESIRTCDDEYADYINTGDTYINTLIFWRGNWRIQSVGDFVETMERNGIKFP